MTQAAEKLAVDCGVRDLYLLTMTAEHFFAARGYQKIDRAKAPQSIQGTTQQGDRVSSQIRIQETGA